MGVTSSDEKKNAPTPPRRKRARGKSIGGKQFKMQIHKIVRKLQYFEVGVFKIPEIVKQFVIGNEFGSGLKPNSHSDAVMVLKKRIVVQVLNWRAKTGTRTETESRNERERRTENRNKLLHSLIISYRHVIIFNLFMKVL